MSSRGTGIVWRWLEEQGLVSDISENERNDLIARIDTYTEPTETFGNEIELPMVYDVEIGGKTLRVIESRYYIMAAQRVVRLVDLLNRCVLWPTTPALIEEIEDEIQK